MDEDFQDFIESYLNGGFQQLVQCKNEKMQIDFSTTESTSKTLEDFEHEIINCNINLLYAYHQWLKRST